MSKILSMAVILALTVTGAAQAWIGTYNPTAAIDARDHVTTYGPAAPDFNARFTQSVLHDVTLGDSNKFLHRSITTLSAITGYAHSGSSEISQAEANSRVAAIQIWGWHDRNGNGRADIIDSINGTTQWTLLSEINPSEGVGNVVGYNVPSAYPDQTGFWGDVLQVSAGGSSISINPGESWILLIRIVNTVGISNLCTDSGDPTAEQWDNGNTSDGIGSDIPNDKYLTADGDTPGADDNRIPDKAVVSVYVSNR